MDIRYQEWLPAADLRAVVAVYWMVDGDGRSVPLPQVLPDGHVELVVNLGDPVDLSGAAYTGQQPDRVIVGPLSRAVRMRYQGRVRTLGIRFDPARGAGFFGRAGPDVVDRMIPLKQVCASLDQAMQDVIDAEFDPSYQQARAMLDALLRRQLGAALPADEEVVRVVRRLMEQEPMPSVAQVAVDLGLSSRQLQRRFLAVVGLTPKRFIRVLRFARVWQIATMSPKESWAAIAADHGYADQAHLSREFRLFGAEAPTHLFTTEWYEKTELARISGPALGTRQEGRVSKRRRR